MSVTSVAKIVLAVATGALIGLPAGVLGTTFVSSACVAGGPGSAVDVEFTKREFFTAYASTFRMSDGSAILVPDEGSGGEFADRALSYLTTLMRNIGVNKVEEAIGGEGVTEKVRLRVCEADVIRLLFMGVLGSFVSSTATDGSAKPSPQDSQSTASSEFLSNVVVDVYTGELEFTNPYNVLSYRSFFLETLLVVSVIVIARLALVQTVRVEYRPAKDKKG